MKAPGAKSVEETRKLRELLQKAKQLAREGNRGPEALEVNTEILNSRTVRTSYRFAKTLGSVAGQRLMYSELTGNVVP